jgi:taurine dioxygenase
LARSFGSLHIHPIYPSIEDVPEVLVLDSWQQDLRDNELWHTDVTFSQTPPLGCVLQAIKIPQQVVIHCGQVALLRLLDLISTCSIS